MKANTLLFVVFALWIGSCAAEKEKTLTFEYSNVGAQSDSPSYSVPLPPSSSPSHSPSLQSSSPALLSSPALAANGAASLAEMGASQIDPEESAKSLDVLNSVATSEQRLPHHDDLLQQSQQSQQSQSQQQSKHQHNKHKHRTHRNDDDDDDEYDRYHPRFRSLRSKRYRNAHAYNSDFINNDYNNDSKSWNPYALLEYFYGNPRFRGLYSRNHRHGNHHHNQNQEASKARFRAVEKQNKAESQQTTTTSVSTEAVAGWGPPLPQDKEPAFPQVSLPVSGPQSLSSVPLPPNALAIQQQFQQQQQQQLQQQQQATQMAFPQFRELSQQQLQLQQMQQLQLFQQQQQLQQQQQAITSQTGSNPQLLAQLYASGLLNPASYANSQQPQQPQQQNQFGFH